MRKSKFISLFLAVLMLVTCFVVTGVSTSAAAGDVIYFDNSVTNFKNVYCYMANNYGSNAQFPGELMTENPNDIWSYTVTGNWNKIIFTDGEIQSTDINYKGGSLIAKPDSAEDDFDVAWSSYPETETKSTTAATEKAAKLKTGAGGTVYCQNDAGWSSVNVYMWNSDSDKLAEWPGKPMTDLGDGVWEYNYSKDYANIIFNSNGSPQTSDLTFPGSGKIFNNKTNTWEDYNSSPVKIRSLTTGVQSPSYTNVSVVISAEASSTAGSLTYKFTVKGDKTSQVTLSEGASSTVAWIPSVADKYKISVEVKDGAGNVNTRSIDFEVKDATTLVQPFISAFTNSLGTNKYLKLNSNVTFTTGAIGGKTETQLLFYKFVITDPDGNDNIPYYTLGSSYSYTPTKKGKYTVTAYVQNAVNDTVNNTYTYECVETIPDDDNNPTPQPVTQSPQPETQSPHPVTQWPQPETQSPQPVTQSPQPVTQEPIVTVPNPELGDVNCDGYINIKDASLIQRHIAKLTNLDSKQIELADVNKDSYVNIKDATMIQKFVAKLITTFE